MHLVHHGKCADEYYLINYLLGSCQSNWLSGKNTLLLNASQAANLEGNVLLLQEK